MRFDPSEKKLEPANQPTYRRQRLSRRWATESPQTAAVMAVTVGKIGELTRHFHGEGGASRRPGPPGSWTLALLSATEKVGYYADTNVNKYTIEDSPGWKRISSH
jgi:hypothetical protein